MSIRVATGPGNKGNPKILENKKVVREIMNNVRENVIRIKLSGKNEAL